jgi:hypothetical protein
MNPWFAIATVVATLGVVPQQAAAPAAPASPQTPAPGVSLQVALTVGAPGGSMGSMAVTEITNGPGHVWSDASFCGTGAGTRDTFPAGVTAWRVSGQILKTDGDLYTVHLEWARVAGSVATPAADSPKTTTVRAGERVLLDRATSANTSCGPELKVEAMVASRGWATSVLGSAVAGPAGGRGIGAGGGRGGGGGGGVGRAGGGGAAATMTGQGSGAGSGSGGGMGVMTGAAGGGRGGGGGGRGGGGGAVAARSPEDTRARVEELHRLLTPGATYGAANPPLDAEIWLVHRLPDGTEEVQQLKRRVGDEYTFKPVTIAIPRSNVTVDVSGWVRFRVMPAFAWPATGSRFACASVL